MRFRIVIIVLLLLPSPLLAQRFAVSTNALDYANFATLNADFSYALAQHWSISAGAKYNPFSFENKSGGTVQNKQRSFALGARWWPWNTWSGWWMSGKLQYREYNSGGIWSEQTREGDSYGGGLSAGYSYMVSPHVNLEVGAGAWAGITRYTVYSCPTCGVTEDKGKKSFVLPNDILLSVSYVF